MAGGKFPHCVRICADQENAGLRASWLGNYPRRGGTAAGSLRHASRSSSTIQWNTVAAGRLCKAAPHVGAGRQHHVACLEVTKQKRFRPWTAAPTQGNEDAEGRIQTVLIRFCRPDYLSSLKTPERQIRGNPGCWLGLPPRGLPSPSNPPGRSSGDRGCSAARRGDQRRMPRKTRARRLERPPSGRCRGSPRGLLRGLPRLQASIGTAKEVSWRRTCRPCRCSMVGHRRQPGDERGSSTLHRPHAHCVRHDGWLVECDQGQASRITQIVDERQSLIKRSQPRWMNGAALLVVETNGRDCTRRLGIVRPGRVEADKGFHPVLFSPPKGKALACMLAQQATNKGLHVRPADTVLGGIALGLHIDAI